MTVLQTVEKVDFVAIKAGKELTIEAADDLAAEMLVRTYVPEYSPDVMTWQEAVALAELRDTQAAYDLEASVKAVFAEDPAEDEAAIRAVNALLASAELADREERDANGPWEVQGL